jgi:hypothetical protein
LAISKKSSTFAAQNGGFVSKNHHICRFLETERAKNGLFDL